MKRYYINGKRVTIEEVKEQEIINARILAIEDPEEMLDALKDAKFITCYEEEGRLKLC